MLSAWNGRVVVLDRVVIRQGGGGHGLPVFVDVEFCTGPYGICGCSYYLVIEAHARSRCPGGVRNASEREIHEGSDWLPSRGKSRSANGRTHKFRSTVVSTWWIEETPHI